MRRKSCWKTIAVFATLMAALALTTNAWAAPKFKVLHAFDVGKKDGGGLYGSLALDAKGNLYGMTEGGGTYGYGTIFELTPHRDGKWSETILQNLNCYDKDGCMPEAGLIFDAAGNLYGITAGGDNQFGSVFELKRGSQGWNLSVLHNGGGRGANLLLDRSGNLYAPLGKGKYDSGPLAS
jgi:uncharacterized repeat protein (TIGR03803 family)